MTSAEGPERALILAPRGRDAAVAAMILGEAGLAAHITPTIPALISELADGAGYIVATEESFVVADLEPLVQWLGQQEEWSDLPFILLTNRGGVERNPTAARFLDALGNVTFLERPFHPTTLVSLARAGVRARRRQYQARSTLMILRDSEAVLRFAERNLRDLNENLESRVAARTEELMRAEEALRHARKMEAVGQLSGGLAHDFNNMLAAISGSVQLIARRISQNRYGDIDRLIAAAQAGVQRAAAMTQKLLAFSRRQTLDPRPTDIAALVAGLEELVRASLGPSIVLETVLQEKLWNALVDRGQLENSILNLCVNARDALPQSGGRIAIETSNIRLDAAASARVKLPAGDYVTICVSDNGSGMSPAVLAHIFDPFFTTKPLGQGTGLGLSMVYGFALQSSGQIDVHSVEAQGTKMSLYLPRYMGTVSDHAQVENAALETGSGEVVLLVDDEPPIRALIKEVLSEAGYDVLEAVDGPSALAVIDSPKRIDLLLTDVGLPNGMNGRQVADAARKLRPSLKVLFITGYAQQAVVQEGQLEQGMEIITKPFDMVDMTARVRVLITAPR